MARLDNAYDVRIQQKQYKKYTEVSGENSTELQVMNLRNSSAQVKQYFAEKVEQQNSIIHISSRFPS